jgi:hypothetical protein
VTAGPAGGWVTAAGGWVATPAGGVVEVAGTQADTTTTRITISAIAYFLSMFYFLLLEFCKGFYNNDMVSVGKFFRSPPYGKTRGYLIHTCNHQTWWKKEELGS